MNEHLDQLDASLNLLVEEKHKFIISISFTKGIRYRLGLPLYGQRTRTNALTPKKRTYGFFGDTKKLWVSIIDNNKKT